MTILSILAAPAPCDTGNESWDAMTGIVVSVLAGGAFWIAVIIISLVG